ncbi:hypothetical protein [Heyndrickxia coagulans]|uniref:hypothetical protein n=1 Tax=Heyndrickxia coagulans TaxID=1398 RepID=UPI0008F8E1B8|nr:hypothetical protein [Heyndrickxia coagulans]APB35678.1 hypothetical protein BIZ35_01935 [Heyndrickxia coagulans]QPG54478.1 hypothetical protein IR208_05110 [Heyndrickxia coagulans]WNE62553.1 hypothetical protein KIY57_05475 [Heyndrickxia coagulans]
MNEEQQIQDQQQEQPQEELETVAKADYEKLSAELEEVKSKLPKELSDDEKAIQAKQKELFDKEVSLTLKEHGLEQFASIVKVSNEDELKETVKALNGIVNQLKIDLGYVPNEHRQQNEYDIFAQKKDTKGMISTKLANLFK